MQKRKSSDWSKLRARLRDVYAANGLTRRAAAIDSFRDRAEHICRRLGVVCDADISRISAAISRSKIEAHGQ